MSTEVEKLEKLYLSKITESKDFQRIVLRHSDLTSFLKKFSKEFLKKILSEIAVKKGYNYLEVKEDRQYCFFEVTFFKVKLEV